MCLRRCLIPPINTCFSLLAGGQLLSKWPRRSSGASQGSIPHRGPNGCTQDLPDESYKPVTDVTLAHIYILGADCPAHAAICFHVWAHLTNLETVEGLFVDHSFHLQVDSLSELKAFIGLLRLSSAHLNFKATAIRNLFPSTTKKNIF